MNAIDCHSNVDRAHPDKFHMQVNLLIYYTDDSAHTQSTSSVSYLKFNLMKYIIYSVVMTTRQSINSLKLICEDLKILKIFNYVKYRHIPNNC